MKRSCKKSLHCLKVVETNRDVSEEVLIHGLLRFRKHGFRTEDALRNLARFCGISHRKAYGLVFRQAQAPIADKERRYIELGVIAAKRWLAEYIRACADVLDQEADLQEARLKQTGGEQWYGSNAMQIAHD